MSTDALFVVRMSLILPACLSLLGVRMSLIVLVGARPSRLPRLSLWLSVCHPVAVCMSPMAARMSRMASVCHASFLSAPFAWWRRLRRHQAGLRPGLRPPPCPRLPMPRRCLCPALPPCVAAFASTSNWALCPRPRPATPWPRARPSAPSPPPCFGLMDSH